MIILICYLILGVTEVGSQCNSLTVVVMRHYTQTKLIASD